jgi:hypothetical protein
MCSRAGGERLAGRAGAHRREVDPATRDRYGAAVSSFPRHYLPTSPPLTWQPMTVRSYHTAFRRRIDRAIIGMEAFRDRRSASGLHLFSPDGLPRADSRIDTYGSTQVRWALEYCTLSNPGSSIHTVATGTGYGGSGASARRRGSAQRRHRAPQEQRQVNTWTRETWWQCNRQRGSMALFAMSMSMSLRRWWRQF